jgi:glyoxylase-like metal-dependent hydrolase (beta-lactamase superfamily II)
VIELSAAPGIHRVHDVFVNWYVAEEAGRLTVVDAGIPGSWRSLDELLARLGRTRADIAAVILTHAHLDHIGIAERLRRETGAPVSIHPADVGLTRHPLLYRTERPAFLYLGQRQTRRTFGAVLRGRVASSPRLREVQTFADGDTLAVPGSPRVVATPGHTAGHVSFHFPAADAVVAGDALVTEDPYTSRTGPCLVARAATRDSAQADASLDAIAATGATHVLPGHGPAWHDGAAEAARLARIAGTA